MAQQLQLLGQGQVASPPPGQVVPAPTESNKSPVSDLDITGVSGSLTSTAAVNRSSTNGAQTTDGPKTVAKSLGPGAKIDKNISTDLTPSQHTALQQIIERYIQRTPRSKQQTEHHRRYLADPRTVSGFRPIWKEMVYPIVVERSRGSKLWDVDGNEYIDLTNGFGLNFFGWSPPFVTEAVQKQLEAGVEIGPQTPLAGRVARLFTEITGQERVAFCNTGSEAVTAALRLARTVTGRNKIATFAGAYHGTFDEVIVRGSAKLKSFPAAPGIMPSMVENILVLDYGSPESLDILQNQADGLAAIMVEPVQSRHPDLQPIDFLRELRILTEQSGTAFIVDEVVTGFRVAPAGIQAYWNIKADLSTYGKIVGGGMPIGVVAGKAQYMDALDGGHWQYGDGSIPEVGVTFFAGTFVRHPLALAAAEAVLLKLNAEGPQLQQSLNQKVHNLVTHLNQHFKRVQAPIHLEHFSSLFYVTFSADCPYGGLLFYWLRHKGIHIWEYRPCFLTLAHTEADIEQVIQSFKEAVAELQSLGFLPGSTTEMNSPSMLHPPMPGARLGKDPDGMPAWYIPDPRRPGKYQRVEGIV